MANEILIVYTTGSTVTFSVYYDNSGTMTARETDTATTEEPADSGLYKGSPSIIENGDIVIAKEGSDIISSAEYQPEVDTVLVKGATPISTADINAQADAALTDYDGPTRTEATADKDEVLSSIAAYLEDGGDIDILLDAILFDTRNAIPAMQDTLDVLLRTILESTTMAVTTVASLASQTSFTLVAGPIDNNALNDCMIVLKSVSTPARKAIGLISDYVGSSKTVTLAADPGIFTLAVGDEVFIRAVPTKAVDDIRNLLEADRVIDTSGTPWVLEYRNKDTKAVLLRQEMENTDGVDIATRDNVLGKLEKE